MTTQRSAGFYNPSQVSGAFSAPTSGPAPGFVDFGDILRIIWRGKITVLALTLLCVVVGYYVQSTLPRMYSANAQIMLDTREGRVLTAEQVIANITVNDAAVASEVSMLQSTGLLQKVIRELDFVETEEFSTDLMRPPAWKRWLQKAMAILPLQGAPEVTAPELAEPGPADAALTDPDPTAPEVIPPEVIAPEVESSEITAPAITEPEKAEPAPTEPAAGEPAAAEPAAAAPELATQEPPKPTMVQLVNAVREHLDVRQEGISYVINIGFRSQDPQLAADAVNTLIRTYIGQQHTERLDATRRATIWLEGRIADLRKEVERAEAAVLRQRADNLTLGQGGLDVATQQIMELSQEMSVARADRVTAEARFGQLKQILAEDGVSVAADVISTPLTTSLRNERAELQQAARELETRFGSGHSQTLSVRAEIGAVDEALNEEVLAHIATLENELDIAVSRERALEDGLREFEQRVVALSNASIETNQLDREAEAVRRVYEIMLMRLYETRAQEALIRADVRIVSLADVPEGAVTPRPKLILAMSGFAGMMLGLAAIFLKQLIVRVFRSPDEVEAALNLPVLAVIPRLRAVSSGRVLDRLRERRHSDLSERFRQLFTSLLFSRGDKRPKSIMVTSSLRGEGKSMIALALAYVSSRAGKSTIIIDADLSNPSLAKYFGWTLTHDLSSVMLGQSLIDDAIRTASHVNFDILPCADPSQGSTASDTLSSGKFKAVLEDLSKRYDIVLVDAPPTLATADARLIGQSIDTSVYVIQSGRTSRDMVRKGVFGLQEVGVEVAGLVLNRTPGSQT